MIDVLLYLFRLLMFRYYLFGGDYNIGRYRYSIIYLQGLVGKVMNIDKFLLSEFLIFVECNMNTITRSILDNRK